MLFPYVVVYTVNAPPENRKIALNLVSVEKDRTLWVQRSDYALRLIGIGTISPFAFAALSRPTPGSALKVCAMWPLARWP
jgi:hypothetical protein